MSKRLIIILSSVLGFLLLATFIAWQFIKTSPQYSVYQIHKSVEQHDYEKFQKYVNVEEVTDNIVNEAFEDVAEESSEDISNDNPFYEMGQNFALGLIQTMKPQLKKKLVSEIKKGVEEGEFQKEYKQKNLLDSYNNMTVTKDGKVATVIIKTPNKDDLKFKMRDMDGYWQIFNMELPLPETDTTTSQSETTYQAKFGERVDINDGWFLTVETPEDYEPTGYFTADEGNKYVSVQITYENTTDSPNSYSTYNFKLKDNKDFSYNETYGGKEPVIESSDLEANGKVTGYMTFEVPQENEPKSIIYSGSKSIVFSSDSQAK